MKTYKLFSLATVLACAASPSWAWYGHGCGNGGGGTGPDPECVVTWDFTQPNTLLQKGDDPELTYTSTSSGTNGGQEYSLTVRGFSVVQYSYNGMSKGTIMDADDIYATDYDGTHAIGVHSSGESTHYGTKIDNVFVSGEDNYKVRDAVLLDFEDCVVSIDKMNIVSAYYNADTDWQLWSWTGNPDELNFSGDNVASVMNASDPGFAFDNATQTSDGGWDLVMTHSGGTGNIAINADSDNHSRYFVLIAGDQMGEYNDAIRLAGLQIECDPTACDPFQPPGGGGVPVPGTLGLLGIGLVAVRRRWLKAS